MVNKCLSVNVSYLELSKGVMVRKGLRINMLNLELLDGVSVSNSLRLTSLTKWVTIGLRFKAKSFNALTRVIATGLTFGVTVSKV